MPGSPASSTAASGRRSSTDYADAFGLDIDPTGYAVGSESVFDAVAASRSLMTLVGERNRVGWPGGLGLVRLPIVDPVPLYPWSLVWRADTVHAGAKRLVSHVKRTYRAAIRRHRGLAATTGP